MSKLIISAELSTNTREDNDHATHYLELDLALSVPDFKCVKGSYKFSKEYSFIVENPLDLATITNRVIELAKKYNQEAILELDNNLNATLIFLEDDRRQSIGKFKKLDSYTIINEDVYICEPVHTAKDNSVRRLDK